MRVQRPAKRASVVEAYAGWRRINHPALAGSLGLPQLRSGVLGMVGKIDNGRLIRRGVRKVHRISWSRYYLQRRARLIWKTRRLARLALQLAAAVCRVEIVESMSVMGRARFG